MVVRGSQRTNAAPTVANALLDQAATAGANFSYQFAEDSFSDADSDNLEYTAVESGGTDLPSWLTFTPATRTFSGTPGNGDVGTVTVEVTADDGRGGTVSDTFRIVTDGATGVLVSNTGQTAFGSAFLSGSSRLAQGFTTGGNAGGYALDEIRIRMNSGFGGSDAVRVGIWSADGDDNPDAILHVLTNPSTFSNGALNGFTAPAGSNLGRNAQYFVVVEATSGSFYLGQTGSDAEDGGAASGWSIADERHSHNGLSWTGAARPTCSSRSGAGRSPISPRRWQAASPTRRRQQVRISRTSSRRIPSPTPIPTTRWNTPRRWPTEAIFRPG